VSAGWCRAQECVQQQRILQGDARCFLCKGAGYMIPLEESQRPGRYRLPQGTQERRQHSLVPARKEPMVSRIQCLQQAKTPLGAAAPWSLLILNCTSPSAVGDSPWRYVRGGR